MEKFEHKQYNDRVNSWCHIHLVSIIQLGNTGGILSGVETSLLKDNGYHTTADIVLKKKVTMVSPIPHGVLQCDPTLLHQELVSTSLNLGVPCHSFERKQQM